MEIPYGMRPFLKEIKNVKVDFHFLDEGERAPVGCKHIPCHIIFDVKMDFTYKARFVAGGHKTDPQSTYPDLLQRGFQGECEDCSSVSCSE